MERDGDGQAVPLPWYREPTKDQWYAWVAAWLGWTLHAFDFTIFLLIIVPIAKHFDVPVTEVTVVLTLTLWGRFIGVTANGWLADRIGRRAPMMISIAWYSVCNFIAGLARPSGYYFCSGRSSASAWAPSGRRARGWRWRPGQRARAALWAHARVVVRIVKCAT